DRGLLPQRASLLRHHLVWACRRPDRRLSRLPYLQGPARLGLSALPQRRQKRAISVSDSSHFISTRGEAPKAGFADVLLAGLAPDGGLYLPAAWPHFSAAEIASFKG